MTRLLPFLAAAGLTLAALAVPRAAAAQDAAGQLGLQVKGKVQVGDRPALIVQPSVPLKSLRIQLTPEGGGRPVTLRTGRLGLNTQRELAFKQGVGTTRWIAKGDVVWANGDKDELHLELETTVYPKIASSLTKADVDLEARELTVRLNQPAGKVDLRVTGDNGEVIHEETTEFSGEAPNTPLTVSWEQPPGVGVLKLEVRAWSQFGFWAGTEITPFEVEIPHEDVEFDTGKWEIRPDQAPKIDKTLELLSEKIQRYGGLVKLQLYIAGYTDSVGSRASNQELSEKRARSIAAHFRKKGVSIPIFYQGFGEDAPAVKTPDETAEQRNRRALYVLSASAPAPQPALPRSAWRRL